RLDDGRRTTLAANVTASLLSDCLWFTKSGDHLAYCADREVLYSGQAPIETYELSTGAHGQLGAVREVVAAPDGSYLTFTTADGQLLLLEDAAWTPRRLGLTDDPNDGRAWASAGVTPSADGRLFTFVDLTGGFHVYDATTRTVTDAGDQAGCFQYQGPGPDQVVTLLAGSAFFLPDGRSIVHPLSGFCTATSTVITGMGRY